MKNEINSKPVIDEQQTIKENKEDAGLLKLMREVDRNDKESYEEIMEKLKED
jgi:hypothetical protein